MIVNEPDGINHRAGAVMEFMTVTGKTEGRRYIAIYRKSFNQRLGAWELEMVPGTLRWIDQE